METIFTKIATGEIPSVKIFEDDQCMVILDIAPMVKGHALVIPKQCYPTLGECPPALYGHLMQVVAAVDARLHHVLSCDATNILINNGPAAGQEVPHLHIHVIPRFSDDKMALKVAKQSYQEQEMAEYGTKLRFTI